MKKTLFLTYILAALLACSAAPQAYAYDEDADYDYTLTDRAPRNLWDSDPDEGTNILDVYEDADDESDDYWGDVVMDDPIYVWSTNGIITNGSVSCPVYIYAGSKLTLAAAQDGLRAADLVYWSSDDIDLSELDEDEKVMIYMEDRSTLDYRDNDLWLGQMSFAGKSMYGYDPTVNLKCNDLVTVSICNRTRDFSIDAHIHFINAWSRLRIEAGTNAVFLNCDQDINLAVDKNDAIYMTGGRFISGYGYRTRLNGATLNLPDNATSKIEGYLCGTSTITLGDGTTVQGRNETSGSYQYFSWLLNNIEVRENCSATMQTGYYGGSITMRIGSSLKFDMDLIPAGVDPDHLEGGAKVSMFVNNTLDLAGRTTALDVTVVGTGNTLQNGTLIGTLTLEDGSYLVSDSAMASWDGPTSITMKNGSRLEMAVGYDEEKMAWRDCWINDISAIKVDGVATIKDAFIRIKPGTEYTLGNGVENLVGEGITSIALDNSIFNLDNKTTNLNIKVWAAFDRYNVIKNGTVNTHVEIDSTGKLTLQNVTLGDNASFTMGNNTQLNMGGASIKLSKITLAESATATVDNGMLDLGEASYTLGIADAASVIYLGQDHALQLGADAAVGNGRLCLPGGQNAPLDYTLNFQNGIPTQLTSNGVTLNLGGNVTFATNHNARFLVTEECIGNPDCPVNISVTADGHFILGDSSRDQTVYGDVNLTHTGDGPAATPGAYDVEMNYRLIGNLTAEMKGRSINIGNIGDDRQDTHPGTATINGASDATVGSFTGASLTAEAAGAVTFNGAVAATADSVVLTGASVSIGGSLAANNASATVESTGGDISITGTLSAMDTSTLNSAEDITIGGNVTGGDLTATAGQSISLQAITIGDKEADLTATNGSIAAGAFTGASLTAEAAGAVTINGDVTSTSGADLTGASVSIGGSLAAGEASANITSTTGDIEITGTLSAAVSSTLDSAENITIGGNMTGGDLTATAAQSITLQAITIGGNAADLTATGGSIAAGAFTGGSLKANAGEAVTINGDVAASVGDAELTGSIVSIQGSLAASDANANITSTTGDIEITGTLSAAVSSTLDSAEDITIGGDVTGGDLKATAADSILMGNIGTSENPVGDAELTAQIGSITAGSFTGNTLKTTALKALTFNGGVTASGNAQWQPTVPTDETEYAVVLEGSGVSIDGSLTANGEQPAALYFKSAGAEQAGAYIRSTGGDITITGDLSAKGSSTLDSEGNITLGTLNGKGEITAGGNVTGGDLKAMADDSILMGNIGTSENPEGDVELTAESGSITAGSFIGRNLTATAAQSILMGNIGTSKTPVGDAVLTAESGSITAGSFTGNTLKATALKALTFNGGVTASGADKWKFATGEDAPAYAVALEGASVSVNGSLTSTAGSIYVKSIGSSTDDDSAATKDITIAGDLSAKGSSLLDSAGSITAGNVTAGLLTATAAGTITLNKVVVSQVESQIVSTGEGGDVTLNSFSGEGAQIKAAHGSITVASGVAGSTSRNRTAFIARDSVTFNGATGDNNLEHVIISTPQANWAHGTTLSDVMVSPWAPPANSPLLLPAAAEDAVTTVNVNGFLTLTGYSIVTGNVVINKQDNVEPIVTVDHSTITGQVSGATKLVLDSGRVGSVKRGDTLTVVSSGKSAITALTDGQQIDSLTLNGGSLTVSVPNQDEITQGQVLVTELTVTKHTELISDMELATYQQTPPSEGELANAKMYFYLTAENEKKDTDTIALLDMHTGALTATAPYFGCNVVPGYLTIDVRGVDLEGGCAYALMSTNSDSQPEFWNTDLHLSFINDSLVQSAADLFWEKGILYYQNGAELKAATWAPTEESHKWNTTDKNWLQDGVRYHYKDGVTTVFDDTAFQDSENNPNYEGEVVLESVYTPSDVQVNNSAGNNYTFMGDGAITGTTTTLTKKGDGSLTIQNANSYSGGTIIEQGTLDVANAGALGSGDVTQVGGTLKLSFVGQTPDFGTVTLQGGTVQIDGGAKSFDLVVTGTEARIEGDADNAFIGSLTLEAGSHLVSDSAMASWDGPTSIVMKNGSTLEMVPGQGKDIWINDITNLRVEGTATMKNVYLRINPHTNGGTYVLGNGVENLRGEGATAYCLDGSTFDLDDKTTNLNIIVWNEQDEKNNYVMCGTIDTNVDIHADSRLYLSDVTIGDPATFVMGDAAFLNMGGRSSKKARLNVFTFTNDCTSATIDDGTLLVEKTKDGSPLKLGTNLQGSRTYVSLLQESSLNLGEHSLAVSKLSLDNAASFATISNGTVDSAVDVASDKALHLGAALNVTGAVSGSGTLVKNDDGGTANVSGSMQGFTGSVQVQGGELNIMGIAEAASLKVADVTINSGSLGVYTGGVAAEANEGTLTITGGHTLTAGMGATLNANLVMGGGSTLDVSAMAGLGGLQMGSTVTLTPGLVLLSGEDMDAVGALGFMGKYDLFNSVDGLSLDGTSNFLAELGLADKWVKAGDVFANDLFKEAEKEYYVFYSGANQAGGNGGNVGTVYIMQVPEPTTSTLSLLALAALAARRRKD